LPVYTKKNFGVLENQYGLIMPINAGMVVVLYYVVTRITERYSSMSVLAVESLFVHLRHG